MAEDCIKINTYKETSHDGRYAMRKEFTFHTFDGTGLYMVQDLTAPPKAAVIIVHGLCEHLGRYEYLTERLNEQNLMVYRFDHRGHGKSEGKRVYYDSFETISDDVNAVAERVKSHNADLPLFIIGHSMGGYAAACFGARYPGKADGIILSGALTRYHTKCAGELPLDVPEDTYVPNALGDGVCSDPAVVEAYNNDPLVEKEISAALLNSIYDGVEWLKRHSGQFTDPVLILHGANDGLVSEKDSRELFGDISSKDKTLKIYAKLFHEIYNEVEKDEVIDDTLLWIEKHLR